jgi:UDP-N-acetyl-D-mannosaminuronate dehydrogenase
VESAEVIRLAATTSLGFTPFFPGVGVGGMYVPVNPHYMLASAPADVQLNTVRGAMNTNTRRPVVLAESVAKALTRPVSGSRLLVLGAAYKPNSRDFRNSAALRLCEELQARGASVRVVEPMIGGDLIAGFPLVPLDEHQVQWADAVICVVAHDAFAGAAELTGAKPLINL